MTEDQRPRVAIIDYGMGNLFSVQQACTNVGLNAAITSERADVLAADAVIIPGIGAYADAIQTLHDLDLVEPIRDIVAAGVPFMGVCLGLQLLMTESYEFGRHQGLDIIPGVVKRLDESPVDGRRTKVPQVGWNRVEKPQHADGRTDDPWANTPLADLSDGVYMYFVHSYVVRPTDPSVLVSTTTYGQTTFCSSLRRGNLFACQYHPERSGPTGLQIYRNFAAAVQSALIGVPS